MVTINSVTLLFLPASFQLPNYHTNHHFFPIQLHKSEFQCFCTKQLIISKPSVQLEKNEITYSPLNTLNNNKLMKSYMTRDKLEHARTLFDLLPERDEGSWSIMISSYTQTGNFIEALDLFEKMVWEGVRPNEFVLECLLKASSELGDVCIGRQLHGLSMQSGIGLKMMLYCGIQL